MSNYKGENTISYSFSSSAPLPDLCEPAPNCPLCPRLYAFREDNKKKYPDFFNSPVPAFYPQENIEDIKLLIVGLAPGLKGANCTGRPFTGDFAGILLYDTLKKYGFAKGQFEAHIHDTLTLTDCAIVNAVRCVPPQNKPLPKEIQTCRPFFSPLLTKLPLLRAVVTLGTVAHQSTIKALGGRLQEHPFGHNKTTDIAHLRIFSSYHCSRYNTNTGRLTEAMFHDVFANVRNFLDKK